MWAVGVEILKWDGASWSMQTVPGSQFVYSVGGSDLQNVWAVGFNGSIYSLKSGTWALQTSGTNLPILKVSSISPSTAWAVGNGGIILRWNGNLVTRLPAGPHSSRPVRGSLGH